MKIKDGSTGFGQSENCELSTQNFGQQAHQDWQGCREEGEEEEGNSTTKTTT